METTETPDIRMFKSLYEKIRLVEGRFARRQETGKDMADDYMCKYHVYANKAAFCEDAKKSGRFRKKAHSALDALEYFGLFELASAELAQFS